jgi:hypothetical protein
MPYGSLIDGATQDMGIDVEEAEEKGIEKDGASPRKKLDESKGKKRKVEGDTPKKSKKAKTVT